MDDLPVNEHADAPCRRLAARPARARSAATAGRPTSTQPTPATEEVSSLGSTARLRPAAPAGRPHCCARYELCPSLTPERSGVSFTGAKCGCFRTQGDDGWRVFADGDRALLAVGETVTLLAPPSPSLLKYLLK